MVARPNIQLDHNLSNEQPISSKILDLARQEPDSHKTILLEDGDAALLTRIHLIRSARKSIDLQTFIYAYDGTGYWVFKELLAAARRGVRVRLLVDHINTPDIQVEAYAALAAAHQNLEIRIFRPIAGYAIVDSFDLTQNTFMRFSTMNYRMHNKVTLIDDDVAIIGGRNIQDAYYDRDTVMNFLDRDVIVFGPSIQSIQHSFDTFWNHKESYEVLCMRDVSEVFTHGRPDLPERISAPIPSSFEELDRQANLYDLESVRPELKTWTVSNIQFVSDRPVKAVKIANPLRQNPFNIIYSLMEEANKEILIQTPYAVFENKTYSRLREIRKSKPNLPILLSTNSISSTDISYVGGLALKQRRFQVEGLKLELYLSRPVPDSIRKMVSRYDLLLEESENHQHDDWWIERNLFPTPDSGPRFCTHGKSIIIDERISLIGSHNFDPRSIHLNSECMVIIEDEAFSRHVADKIRLAIHPANSWVVAPRNLPPVVGDLNNLISWISSNLPFFDIWPLEHVSCFEIKEGMEPLSPYEKGFHDRYEDVGPFPDLDLGLEQIKVLLIRSFGGPALPLM